MAFLNSFVQQLVLFIVFVACAAVAVFIGISLRKRKNKKEEAGKAPECEETEQTAEEGKAES